MTELVVPMKVALTTTYDAPLAFKWLTEAP